MDITVRIAAFADLAEVIKVEKATMGSFLYAENAWNHFLTSPGAFLLAYKDNILSGIAHLAVLPDKALWFETLRVSPEQQNQGVGKALYQKALELAETEFQATSFSMYTGPKNLRSSNLAARYGLNNVYPFKEYAYEVKDGAKAGSFCSKDWTRAEEILLPLKERYHDFWSMNRTMLRFSRENLYMLADRGFLFEDEEKNALVCGSRFQHANKLYVSLIKGDYAKCLDFARNLAKSRNIPLLVCTFAFENPELEKALTDYGFTFSGDLIVRERVF